jgi:hypothetical protein
MDVTGTPPPQQTELLIDQATGLIDQAATAGITLRLLGGIAVAIRCPSAGHRALKRAYADIDFMAGKGGDLSRLDGFAEQIGYLPEKRFNSLHGRRRRLYFTSDRSSQIDVFISVFEMCHQLPLEERLHVDTPTIPLAELFLSKAQIVELNRKDLLDLLALLADHEVAEHDEDAINGQRIGELCARDWGLWRTVTGTLKKVRAAVEAGDPEHEASGVISSRIDDISEALERAPKSRRWKMRARVGDRVQWYELPEDVHRGAGT